MIEFEKSLSLPPGTPVFIGRQKNKESEIEVIVYNKDELDEFKLEPKENAELELKENFITWVNFVGLHDVKAIEKLANAVSVDSILVEDIVNTSRRPKIEDIDDYFFFIVKDLRFDEEQGVVQVEHIAFIVGQNFVFTFQEIEGDNFNMIRDRLRKSIGRMRRYGVDYLFNRLLDSIVDNYFLVIHQIGERIELLEDKVINEPTKNTLSEIQHLKQEIIMLRRICLPVREVVGIMLKLETVVISNETQIFVRSIFDHLNQIIDSVEIYREMLSGFLEIYLSSLSNKTNEVMKVLTIVTTIFIPLSFLAGVYGMNFDNMPELHARWGYFVLWFFMSIIAGIQVYFFKRLGWLSSD